MESVDLGDGTTSMSSQQQNDSNDKVPVSLEHIQIETPEERLLSQFFRVFI